MTTRVICDGCGAEPERRTDLQTITIIQRPYGNAASSNNFTTPEFELCGSCLRTFKDNLPLLWLRFGSSSSIGSGGAGGHGANAGGPGAARDVG